jgi:hypothetical protein
MGWLGFKLGDAEPIGIKHSPNPLAAFAPVFLWRGRQR